MSSRVRLRSAYFCIASLRVRGHSTAPPARARDPVAPRRGLGRRGGAGGHAVGSSRHVGQRGRPRANLGGSPISDRDNSRNSAARTQSGGAVCGSARPPLGYPTPVGRRTLRRVARAAQHGGVGDVERRTASGERHDVIDGQVGGGVGGALVARAPVAVLATPGAEHAGAEPLPGPRAVEGVVPAAVGLPRRARCSGYPRGW